MRTHSDRWTKLREVNADLAARMEHAMTPEEESEEARASDEFRLNTSIRAKEEREAFDAERLRAAQEAQEAMRRARLRVPDGYVGVTLTDVRPIDPTVKEAVRQARLYVDNFDKFREKGIGFVFYGAFGTGKTMTACAILNELVERVEGRYVTLWSLIKIVKDSQQYGASEEKVRALIDVPLLVIDEIGVQQGNSFEENTLMQVLDERVSSNRPTIYVTNLYPDSKDESRTDTIRAKIGQRLFNRIFGKSWFIQFKGESQRKRLPSIDEMLKGDI